MLYPKNAEALTKELFEKPGSEYRGAPFWAWNTRLLETELLWQIEQLRKMGFGGFHMHSRTGMATEYLGTDFMALVGACVEKARALGMLAWLYDEDRWPSGAAGGLVTRDPAYRARHLLLTRRPYAADGSGARTSHLSRALAVRAENGSLLACFDIRLDDGGALAAYNRIGPEDVPQGFKLYVYEETTLPSPWFNHQSYVDTLNGAAIRAFIEITYGRYRDCVGDDFGKLVPAIFTDEPQFSHKGALAFAADETDVTLPWTTDFPMSYRAAHGEDIIGHIPELLWDWPAGQPSRIRYRYHDHLAERFSAAFADQCGAWCEAHGIALTGHMMCEGYLDSQTATLGEAMRSYRAFALPGIDMLCDWREYNTAKQAQSAARQYGRPGVLSELYGVTNWDFDFRGHKLQGDWQAALGVTIRVPHLSWVSMNGEAKRDYPASFNYQAPWYREYPYIEDHFARVNTAMTRGEAICRVAVIHPIESYWLHWGPGETTAAARRQMEERFADLTRWLLCGCMDFDFVCESLLPGQCELGDMDAATFPVGAMRYEVIIVPALETIRATTLERLEAFAQLGGRIIFLGEPPRHVEAMASERPGNLAAFCERLPFARQAILTALESVRDVGIREMSGALCDNLIYQLRADREERWLFIAHADRPENPDMAAGRMIMISIRGHWSLRVYDTLTGAIRPLDSEAADGFTRLKYPLYEHDSLLLGLTKRGSDTAGVRAGGNAPTLISPDAEGDIRFLAAVPVTLHEPNVLLLDMAEYALGDEPWRGREEILRLDNVLRRELAWPTREDAIAQPWVDPAAETPHLLRLRFVFDSELGINDAQLALENAAMTSVRLNGAAATPTDGWYVDKCMATLALPAIRAGRNVLELTMPYGRQTDVEACYLLGDFGVRVAGCQATLTAPVKSLFFGDIVGQGLPFYGGNLSYHLEAVTAGDFAICVSHYRGHLLRVAVNGADIGPLVFSPYRIQTQGLSAGRQKIDLTYFGSRINTFGQLHRLNRHDSWWGPNSWRTSGDKWSYGYHFWPQGVLKSPEIYILGENP